MTGRNGLTLVEVVIVVAIIAISLSLAGPRIGAGLGRLELTRAERTVQSYLKLARARARQADDHQYVVLDRRNGSVALLGAELRVVRQEQLPSSVEMVFVADNDREVVYVAPSGISRGNPIRLRGRTGETELAFQ
jgi:prepilin-type N-terminal cleavage/methylation domain-containing protein